MARFKPKDLVTVAPTYRRNGEGEIIYVVVKTLGDLAWVRIANDSNRTENIITIPMACLQIYENKQ